MLNNNMDKLFAEGGMNQQGGTTDPVSGNEVPTGSLQKEVRDDIPAQLSEGEFVLPADVVRYIGLDRLMKLRDKAKEGLAKMEEIGQMGNADQVENPEASHGEDFSAEIDSIMGEVDSEKNHLAGGGMPTPATPEVKQFKKPDGNSMFVTFINGEPATPIPEGAQEITGLNANQKVFSSLTNTEKEVNKKTDVKDVMTSSQSDLDKRLEKALFDKVTQYATEKQNKDTINKNIEFDSSAFKHDQDLVDVSDALDYNLTTGMDSQMLSGELDNAATSSIMETPEVLPEVLPPVPLAKGGLVSRRQK
jgi:hypothetical protein